VSTLGGDGGGRGIGSVAFMSVFAAGGDGGDSIASGSLEFPGGLGGDGGDIGWNGSIAFVSGLGGDGGGSGASGSVEFIVPFELNGITSSAVEPTPACGGGDGGGVESEAIGRRGIVLGNASPARAVGDVSAATVSSTRLHRVHMLFGPLRTGTGLSF
jgi:hypothetical protein